MSDPIIKFENISKQFPGVRALNGVSFEIERGTTHCIIGENGAGKSTLMKILSGVQKQSDGEMIIDGEPMIFSSTIEAMKAGVGTVYQELSNFGMLDVAENLFSGDLPKNGGLIDWKKLYKDTQKVLDDFDMQRIKPKDMMMSLSLGTQQMIEIAKLLIRDVKIVILDEPTSALAEAEVKKLFDLIEQMKSKGITVLFISHKLDEVLKLADNITILKDGQHVTTFANGPEIDTSFLIRNMVGRDVAYDYKAGTTEAGDLLLEVKGLSSGKSVRDASFKLRRGEVIGFAGLDGSGQTELFESIIGWRKRTSGTISMNGRECKITNPMDAQKNKIGYITKERKTLGLFLGLSVRDNISAVASRRFLSKGVVSYKKSRENAENYVKKMSIKVSGLGQQVMNLSGGNQQKVLLSMWMSDEPEVLLIDEPTRGVDVGAKSEIHALIRSSVAAGKGVAIISSELNELMAACDRIIVMHEGKIKGELSLGEYSEEKIMNLAYEVM